MEHKDLRIVFGMMLPRANSALRQFKPIFILAYPKLKKKGKEEYLEHRDLEACLPCLDAILVNEGETFVEYCYGIQHRELT